MQGYLVILSFLGSFALGLEDNAGKHWAVLVAGSNGWSNYRHQADVCHAYQLLKKNGISTNQIITMMYDDIANNKKNPFPGKIFNEYEHQDVYAGVKIDYRGEDVSPENFMRVMKGDKKLKANGRKVLESGPEDNVFVYFSDHGTRNLFAFPTGVLWATDLNDTLTAMKEARRFNKLVIYMEACYSGSMFENILPSNISVFTMTASNPTESSWAALCADPEIDTCLGNEFTHQWMTDTEKRKVNKWTLGEQYSTVKSAVKNSHVSKYGDLTMTLLPIGEFQGSGSNARSLGNSEASWSTALDRSMSSHAHLVSLMHQLKRSNSLRQRELAQQHLHRALQLSKFAKDTVDEVVEEVISQAEPNGKPSDVHKHLECFRKVYEQYELKCFSIQQVPELSDELDKFDHLCEQGYDANVIVQAIFATCD